MVEVIRGAVFDRCPQCRRRVQVDEMRWGLEDLDGAPHDCWPKTRLRDVGRMALGVVAIIVILLRRAKTSEGGTV